MEAGTPALGRAASPVPQASDARLLSPPGPEMQWGFGSRIENGSGRLVSRRTGGAPRSLPVKDR
jgi:hypothetical protein